MSALDRLRAMERMREGAHCEPTKPTKGGFDGFEGSPPPIVPNASHDAGIANSALHARWHTGKATVH